MPEWQNKLQQELYSKIHDLTAGAKADGESTSRTPVKEIVGDAIDLITDWQSGSFDPEKGKLRAGSPVLVFNADLVDLLHWFEMVRLIQWDGGFLLEPLIPSEITDLKSIYIEIVRTEGIYSHKPYNARLVSKAEVMRFRSWARYWHERPPMSREQAEGTVRNYLEHGYTNYIDRIERIWKSETDTARVAWYARRPTGSSTPTESAHTFELLSRSEDLLDEEYQDRLQAQASEFDALYRDDDVSGFRPDEIAHGLDVATADIDWAFNMTGPPPFPSESDSEPRVPVEPLGSNRR